MATKSRANQTAEENLQTPSDSSRGALDNKSGAPRARLKALLRRFGPYLGLAVFLLLFVALLRWLDDEAPLTRKQKTVRSSLLQIESLRSFTVRKNGQKLWEISAKRVALSGKADQTIAEDVSKAVFFNEGKPFLNLKAPRVQLSNVTNNLEATGGVFASGPQKFSFYTPLVRWLNQEKLVQCPQSVRATLRAFEFDAPGLLYSWNSGELLCKQKVELRTEGAVLRSNMLKANVKSRKIELGGGVELVFDPKTANFQKQLAPSGAR